MSDIIDVERLIDLGAERSCPQLARFAGLFPDGAKITGATFDRAVEAGLDVAWLAARLLPAPALAEYRRATVAALAEYRRATVAAEAEYKRTIVAAWAVYERAIAPAEAEYKRATVAAEAEYRRAIAPAEAEYKRATAPAWAEYERATAPARAVYRRTIATALKAAVAAIYWGKEEAIRPMSDAETTRAVMEQIGGGGT